MCLKPWLTPSESEIFYVHLDHVVVWCCLMLFARSLRGRVEQSRAVAYMYRSYGHFSWATGYRLNTRHACHMNFLEYVWWLLLCWTIWTWRLVSCNSTKQQMRNRNKSDNSKYFEGLDVSFASSCHCAEQWFAEAGWACKFKFIIFHKIFTMFTFWSMFTNRNRVQ